MVNLEVGDIVLCTVEKIDKTIVFVKIDKNGTGSIILSEIAPGRIRNLRDYVVPKKTIICKVLRTGGDRVQLSLRRVTPKEQKEVREEYKHEKSCKSIIQSVLKEKSKEIIEKILENGKLHEFLDRSKEDQKNLEKLVGKEDAEKILAIANLQKKKTHSVRKEIKLTTNAPNGLTRIKEMLGKIKEAKIRYLASGKYSLETEAEDIKSADNKVKNIIEEIAKECKKNKIEIEIKEK